MLASFAPKADWSLLDHVTMQDVLETIFDRKVDLLSRRGLQRSRNYLRCQAILDSAKAVYVVS